MRTVKGKKAKPPSRVTAGSPDVVQVTITVHAPHRGADEYEVEHDDGGDVFQNFEQAVGYWLDHGVLAASLKAFRKDCCRDMVSEWQPRQGFWSTWEEVG